MSARELLSELRERGVELVPDGDRLRYRPKEAITEGLLGRLKAHKQQLLKLLEWERRKLEEADRRGLVIRWSKVPGWIVLHDPTDGSWHEVKASECLPGIVETANAHSRKKKEVQSSE